MPFCSFSALSAPSAPWLYWLRWLLYLPLVWVLSMCVWPSVARATPTSLRFARAAPRLTISYLEHSPGFTPQELEKSAKERRWRLLQGHVFTPPRRDIWYWLRLRLHFPSDIPKSHRWALFLRRMDLEKLEVFVRGDGVSVGGRWRRQTLRPYAAHSLTRHMIFPVATMPGKEVTLYLRVKTSKTLAWHGQIAITHRPPASWLKQSQWEMLFCGLYYGVILSLVVVYLFLFLWMGDRAALWFVLYHLALALYMLGGNGLLYPLIGVLGLTGVAYFRSMSVMLGAYIFGAILYTRVFLSTAQNIPRLDRLIRLYLALVSVYIFLAPWAHLSLVGHLSQLLGMLSPLVTVLPGWVLWRRGFPPALIYFWAWGLFSAAAFVYASPLFERWGFVIFQVGSGISALLLSLAMVQRIRLLREEQQQAAEQIQRSEQMATLGQLVAGVAHEVNNPNNFITFNLPILRQYIDALAPHLAAIDAEQPSFSLLRMSLDEFLEDTYQLIDNMEHGAQRIAGIVDELRAYVRSHEVGERQRVPLTPTIERALALVEKQVRQQVSQFKISLDDDLPHVLLYPGRIEQVLINVLLNAAQATAEQSDGSVSLEVFRDPEREGWVVLQIKDNGPGIPDALREQIFAPFFTTKGRESSMGLGLSISQGIVREHGGTITTSRVARGACFVIALPTVEDGS